MYFDFIEKFKQLNDAYTQMRNENFAMLGHIYGKLWKEEDFDG